MNLTAQLTSMRQETKGLSRDERAKLCCDLAKQLEKVGEYDAAAEAMNEFWPDREAMPNVHDLDDTTRASVLLRVGALAGWIGGSDQTGGSQERAKDLITQAVEIFEGTGAT